MNFIEQFSLPAAAREEVAGRLRFSEAERQKLADIEQFFGMFLPNFNQGFTEQLFAWQAVESQKRKRRVENQRRSIKREIKGGNHRIETFYNHVKEAQRRGVKLVIVFGCDDSRVFEPSGEHSIKLPDDNMDGDNKDAEVIFLAVPVIGGRAPTEAELTTLIDELQQQGVDLSQIEFWMLQHADDGQFDNCIACDLDDADANTCGALAAVQALLNPESDEYSPMFEAYYYESQLERANYSAEDIVALEQETGMPLAFLEILAELEPSLTGNIFRSGNKLQSLVNQLAQQPGRENLSRVVREGLYQHDHKMIALVAGDKENIEEVGERIVFHQAEKRTEPGQDPEQAVISADRAIGHPDYIWLPRSVRDVENNDFNMTCASTAREHLRKVFAELWYLVSHTAKHAQGNGHGPSFANTERIIILAADDQAVAEIIAHFDDPEFDSIKPHIQVGFDAVFIVNMEKETVKAVKL